MVDFSSLMGPTVFVIIFIVIGGVALKTWAGMIGKSYKEININLILFTFIISCITGIGIVAPNVENWGDDLPVSTLLALIAVQVLAIYGADSLGKRVVKMALKK